MRPIPVSLVLGTLLLTGLIWIIPRWVEVPVWSIFYLLHEQPAWVRRVAVLAPAPLALIAHLPFRARSRLLATRIAAWVGPGAAPWLVGGLAFPAFWLFRETRHWGDATLTVAILEGQSPVPALGRWFWREPLDRLLAVTANDLAYAATGAGAATAVALLSCLAGGVFAALLVPMARHLGQEGGTRVFAFGFVLSMGASQLFFGHVENYTLVTTAMLAFFLVCARLLDGGGSLWQVWLVAALALTVHAQAAFLIVPLLTLVWLLRGRAWRTPRDLLVALLPGVLYLACFYALCRWLGAPQIEVGANRYAGQAGVVLGLEEALRPRHLWNVLQGYVLTLPFGAFLALPAALFASGRSWRDPLSRVLLAGCLSFGLFNLFFDAQLARRQDWSLFAPAALPVALLAARLVALRLDARVERPVVATFLVLMSLAISVPWVASNHLAGRDEAGEGAPLPADSGPQPTPGRVPE